MLGGSRHRHNLWCLRQRRIRDCTSRVCRTHRPGQTFRRTSISSPRFRRPILRCRIIDSFYGFIAVSASEPTSWVLALRGTEDLMEWWDDFH